MEDSAELVSSGTFKVDRARALDKLMRFQLPDAAMFVLPLLRCAVGSGAARIRIETGRGGGLASSRFEMRFDGRPFTLAELADPYSVLFTKRTAETSRNRELAIALLTGLRVRRDLLAVTSGPPGARVRLDVESLRSEKAQLVRDDGTETVFELRRGELVGSFDDAAAIARRSCGACRVSVLVDGQEAANIPSLDPETSVYFDGKGTRGWLTVPRTPLETSTIRAFTYGIEVGAFDYRLPRFQVEGFVNDDGFTLNVSQTGVSLGGRFKTAMSIGAEQSDKLVLKVLAGNEARLARAAELIRTKGCGPWASGLDRKAGSGGPGLLAALGRVVKSIAADRDRERESLESMGAVTAWLLDACERNLHDPARDAKTPLLKALWEGPLLLGVKGEAMSLKDVVGLRERMGFVPVSRRFPDSGLSFPAVWSSSDRVRRLLGKLFSDSIKDVTPMEWEAEAGFLKVKVSAAVSTQADIRVLDRMGLGEILIRDSFILEGFAAEVAIPAAMTRDMAQVYLWEEAGPRLLDMSPRVRFAAALVRSAGPDGPVTDAELGKAVASVSDLAAGLHRRLANEYDCWKTDPRTAAVRRALLDLLAAALASGTGRSEDGSPVLAEGLRWLGEVSLFRTESGWADYHHFRVRFDEGKVLCAAPSIQAFGTLRPERSIIGPEYTNKMMESILPGSGSLPMNGDLGARLWFKRTPAVGCEHGSPLGCLVSAGSPAVHLALGEVEGGSSLHLPWGTVTALGADASRPDIAAELAGRLDLAAAMAAAVVEAAGTCWECPDLPARRFLLKTVPILFAPWPGKPVSGAEARPCARLKEFLSLLPFFQTAAAPGISLSDLGGLLATSEKVSYVLRRPGLDDPSADLILDKPELEAIRQLWPIRGERLVNVGGPDRPEKLPVEGPWQDPVDAPAFVTVRPSVISPAAAPGAAGSSRPFPAPLHLMADEEMLFERRYEEPGLRALIGLPERWKDTLTLVVRKAPGEPPMVMSPKGLPLVGTAILDTSVAADPDLVPEEEAVAALFARFYADLLDAWPLGGAGDSRHRSGVRYLLRILELNLLPEKKLEGVWGTLMTRMWTLKMLPALGLEYVSLEDLAYRARGKGFLPFAAKAFYLSEPGDAWVPVLGRSEQLVVSRLVCKRLGVKLRAYKPGPKPQPAPETAAPGPAAGQAPAAAEPSADAADAMTLVVLRRILKNVRGRRGVKVLPASLEWREDGGSELALFGDPQKIGINKAHPMVKAAALSGLDEARQAYYLASMVFTSFNRAIGEVTDLDDIRFHESLADVLASPKTGTPAGDPPVPARNTLPLPRRSDMIG